VRKAGTRGGRLTSTRQLSPESVLRPASWTGLAGDRRRRDRPPELAEVDLYEVGHPASRQDKRNRINGLRPVAKSLTHVSVDFGRDPCGLALSWPHGGY
jgi:hypothetical protein